MYFFFFLFGKILGNRFKECAYSEYNIHIYRIMYVYIMYIVYTTYYIMRVHNRSVKIIHTFLFCFIVASYLTNYINGIRARL